MTAMYKEEVPKASVALTRTTAETVTSGGNVTWRATITNTSQAPLTTATIKKSTAWTTGLAAPTAMIVTPRRNRENSSRHSDYVDQWC